MANFDHSALDWNSKLLHGWAYVEPVTKWFQGTFRNVHKICRTCPTCREIIKIDVTESALRGTALNHGLALRRCSECRKALKRTGISNEYEERKATGEQRRATEPQKMDHILYEPDNAPLPDLSKLVLNPSDGWTVEDEMLQLRGDFARTQRNLDAARAEIARLKASAVCPKCIAFDETTERLRKEWLAKNPQSVSPYTGGFATQEQIDAGLVDEWKARQSAAPENNLKKLPWEA